jgi:hypothetical protein
MASLATYNLSRFLSHTKETRATALSTMRIYRMFQIDLKTRMILNKISFSPSQEWAVDINTSVIDSYRWIGREDKIKCL